MSVGVRFVARISLPAALLLSGPLLAQDKKKPTADLGTSYTKQIVPILKDRCEPCHYTKDKKGGLDVTTFAALMKGGKTKNPPIVTPGDPDKSLLLKDISGKDPPMPKNANPLTPPQIEAITKWIKEGARNN
jgi:hypothetical protein